MSRDAVTAYISSHLVPIASGLHRATLGPDFGEADMDAAAIAQLAAQIIALGNEPDPETGVPLRYYDPERVSGEQNLRAFVNEIRGKMGVMVDAAGQIQDLVGKAPPGEQPGEPPPVAYDSFGGSWGAEHNPAFDLYPQGEEGPHFGYPFPCPAAGTVTRYSFGPGPLGIHATIDGGRGQAIVLDMAPTADTVQKLLLPEHVEAIRALGTFMHIAVLTFDQPQRTPGGQTVRAIWIGHCQDGFPVGGRSTGDLFCLTGRSGIEFPGVDAAHGHVCGTATGALSPNGDVPGIEVARLLGFNPRVTRVPGPADYQARKADRGKWL